MLKRSILLSLCSLGIILSSYAQETKKVLFIGNSYTYFNNMPSLLAGIASANGDSLIHDSSTPGGYYFRLHKSNATTISKINSQAWDYVVMQEQSQIPSLTAAIVGNDWSPPHAMVLDSLIKANNTCTETVFFMTWGRKNGDASYCGQHPPVCTFEGMQMALGSTYSFMADENNSTLAPVGMAWREARQQDSMLNLYTSDGSHPNINGSYLTACVFYATLYRKPSLGTTFYSTVDTLTAQFLQQVADQIVFDSLQTWRIGHEDLLVDYSYTALSNLEYEFSNNSINANAYLWDFNGITDTLLNPVYAFPGPGTYTVQLTAYNDCDTLTTSQQITITATKVEDLKEEQLVVYPNPSTGVFNLNFEKNKNKSIRVFDVLGQLVFEKANTAESQVSIDLEAEGVYYLELLEEGERKAVLKLVKK